MSGASASSPIVRYGDPLLSRKAEVVEDFSKLPELISRMRDAMLRNDGIGIAAPQIGTSLRIFLVAPTLLPQHDRGMLPSDVFINPKLLRKSFKRVAGEEGCLSLPGVFGIVQRSLRVSVEAQDLSGKRFRVSAEGLLARVLQHELDHLDGLLFIARAEPHTLHEILPDGRMQPWSP